MAPSFWTNVLHTKLRIDSSVLHVGLRSSMPEDAFTLPVVNMALIDAEDKIVTMADCVVTNGP